MRKITSLLMLFCAFAVSALAQVTDLSQLSNDKIYAIRSARCFLLYSEANAGKLSTSTATAITNAEERVANPLKNANQQFKIQKTGENYYLYSVGANKYLAEDGSLTETAKDALSITNVKATYPKYPWKLCVGVNGLNSQIAGQAATGIAINSWTTTDAGNSFQIFEIEDWPLVKATDELTSLVSETKNTFINTINSKYKVTLQTTDANAPFYLSATQDADGNAISKAIDNNSGTFYGSSWGASVGHLHYWQVDLADAANLEAFTFNYITRANGNDVPTQINVQGSTDGTTFTDIVVLTDGLPRAGGATYKSASIVNNGYRYLRFEVPSTTNNYHAGGNQNEVTIAIAEFSLYNAPYTLHDNTVNNAIIAAEAVLNASNNTLQTVQNAIAEFNAALVDGQCTVNYRFTYNDVEKYTQTTTTFVGEEWPNITVTHPLGVSVIGSKPEGAIAEVDVVDGVATKTFALDENVPFAYAADYASIAKWYYLKFNSNKNCYLHHDEGQDYIDLDSKAVDASNKDAYSWAFIGNPYDGYQIVNKSTGEGYILSSTTTIPGNGGNTFPVMTATSALPEGNNTHWFATASSHATNGFFLAQKGFANNRMNDRGKLAYWTDNAGEGSTFVVEERDMSGRAELQAAVDAVVAENYVGGTSIGYYTEASVAGVNTALTAAQTALAGELTAKIATEKQTALQAAVAALQVVLPEEGKYYVIESAKYAGDLVYANKDNRIYHSNQKTNNLSEVIWQFENNGDGTLSLYSVSNNQYISQLVWQNPSLLSDATTCKFTIHPQGNGVVFIKGNGHEMHAQSANAGALVYYNTNEKGSASSWYIKEVSTFSQSATIGETGWSSLVLGFDAEIPEGIKVYAVTSIEGELAKLTEVEGTIPAGEAVLLNGAADSYVFNLTSSAAEVAGNMLEGTLFDANITEEAYVLSAPAGVAGFYKAKLNVSTDTTNDGTAEAPAVTYEAWKNNAFKAYLPVASEAAVLKFNFGGNTTAIESVVAPAFDANAPIYDLSGRRVMNAVKGGLYIQNGKKFIVK